MIKRLTEKAREVISDESDKKTVRVLILVLGACFIAWCLVMAITL